MHLNGREYEVAFCKASEINVKGFPYTFSVIPNKKNCWAADPFPVEVGNDLYIFAELMEYRTGRGAIAYCKKTNNGFTEWQPIIRENYHLSFPNVFCVGNTFYMCAETNESEHIYLYRCECFPDKWIRDNNILLVGRYVDTIFYKEKEQIFGITYNLDSKKMQIFKIDGDRANLSEGSIETIGDDYDRPAGKIFFDDVANCYLLPGQIGIPKYGSGLIFKTFDLKWPNFKEKEYKRILPRDIKVNETKKYDGVHTFNVTKNYIVIDLIWTRFSVRETLFKIFRRLGICGR